MIKTIIVDDEITSRETIKYLIAEYFSHIEISAEAESVDEAVNAITRHKPDLVFMDIEIKGGTGIQVLKQLTNHDFKLIFITAFNDFAIKAIKAEAAKTIKIKTMENAQA